MTARIIMQKTVTVMHIFQRYPDTGRIPLRNRINFQFIYRSVHLWHTNKKPLSLLSQTVFCLEVPSGFEPLYKVLQTSA